MMVLALGLLTKKLTVMKKFYLIIASLVIFQTYTHAQKGTNKLMLGADVAIPTGDFADLANVGGGIMGKLLFGISGSDQITATTGVTFHGGKSLDGIPSDLKLTMRVIPILGGYRHNFNGLFIEPQVGVGIFGATAKYQGESDSNSDNGFAWAVGFGYSKNNFETGVRYQSFEKDGSLSLIGIHIGYIFPLKKK
jgi:hypothetical protein